MDEQSLELRLAADIQRSVRTKQLEWTANRQLRRIRLLQRKLEDELQLKLAIKYLRSSLRSREAFHQAVGFLLGEER